MLRRPAEAQLPLFDAAAAWPAAAPVDEASARPSGAGADEAAMEPCRLYSLNGPKDDSRLRLHLGKWDLPCRIRRRRGAISLRLEGAGLAIGCAAWVSHGALSRFVGESRDWLLRQIHASVDLRPPRDALGRALLMIDGRLVATLAGAPAKALGVGDEPRLDGSLLLLPDRRRAAGQLREWLRARTEGWLARKLPAFAACIGADCRRARIGHFKAQWGSCVRAQGGGHNLSFNARLAMMPGWVRDYVLLHELCHCLNYSHNPSFWRLLDKHCLKLLHCTSGDARAWHNRHDALIRVDFDHFFAHALA